MRSRHSSAQNPPIAYHFPQRKSKGLKCPTKSLICTSLPRFTSHSPLLSFYLWVPWLHSFSLLDSSSHTPTCGPLHSLFPLPGAHFPQIGTWLTSLFPSDVFSNIISVRPTLSTLFKIVIFYRLPNSVIFLYFYPSNTCQFRTYHRIYLFTCFLGNVCSWLLEYKVHEGRELFLLLTLLCSKWQTGA